MKLRSVMGNAVICLAFLGLIIVAPSGRTASDVLWSVQEVATPTINAAIAFSPDGEIVATGRRETRDVYLRTSSEGTLIRVLNGKNNNTNAMAFSPDSQLLVNGTAGPGQGLSLNLWRVTDGVRLVGRIPAHPNGTIGVTMSPDGQTVATCGFHDRTLMFWHVPDMTQIGSIENVDPDIGSSFFAQAIAFSPDGQLLATGDSQNIKLRHWPDLTIVRTMANSAARNYVTLAFSPDGSELVAGLTDLEPTYATCVDCSVKLWRVADGALLHTFLSSEGELRYTKVGFSDDGHTIAAGFETANGAAGAIQFWNTENGASSVDKQPSAVHAFAFSPGGRFYGYILADGTVAVARTPLVEAIDDQTGGRRRYSPQ
jgi:WD40 repeat protein